MPKYEEWEPNATLVVVLKELSLRSEIRQGEALAELRPHVEEALAALGCLERRRGLFHRERIRREAIGMLLASIERAE